MLEPWPQGKPRRVSVNSFGYGGTNAHCILESAETYFDSHKTHGNGYANGHSRLLSSPDPTDSNGSTEDNDLGQDQSRISRTQVFVLSSASKNTTLKLMPNLRDYLDEREQSHGTTLLSDLAYTLYSRRSALPWRLAIAAATPVDLAAEFSRTDRIPQLALSEPKAGFVFTGQGAQWPGMAVELMKTYPVFRSSMVKADKYFKSLGASWSLLGTDPALQVSTILTSARRVGTAFVDLPNSYRYNQPAKLYRNPKFFGRSPRLVECKTSGCLWSFKRRDLGCVRLRCTRFLHNLDNSLLPWTASG